MSTKSKAYALTYVLACSSSLIGSSTNSFSLDKIEDLLDQEYISPESNKRINDLIENIEGTYKDVPDVLYDSKIPDDKIAVLGLVTTKSSRHESVEMLRARILEASKYCPLERLAISPQCGFATSIEGNELGIDDQKVKLRTLVETASEVWG